MNVLMGDEVIHLKGRVVDVADTKGSNIGRFTFWWDKNGTPIKISDIRGGIEVKINANYYVVVTNKNSKEVAILSFSKSILESEFKIKDLGRGTYVR